MVGRLSAAIAQQKDVSVQLEALDILGDLLSRFGGLLIQFHPNLLDALLPQLKSPRLAVRKRYVCAPGIVIKQLFYNPNQIIFGDRYKIIVKSIYQSIFLSSIQNHHCAWSSCIELRPNIVREIDQYIDGRARKLSWT